MASRKTKGTREKILEASLALFRKKGFDATTMRDIAAASGVALGGAYYYFASKEAIVLAYYEHVHRESTAKFEVVLAETSDVRARLGAAFHATIDVIAKDRKLLSGLFRSIADPSSGSSVFGAETKHLRADGLVRFDRAIATAPELVLLDPQARQVLVLALWSLHMGVMLFFVHDASRGQEKTRALIDRSLDLVVGLMPIAPQLAPMFGDAVGSILRDSGLLPGAGVEEKL